MKALVKDGKVWDTSEKGFEVHADFSWVDCDDTVKAGHTYDGSNFTAPTKPTLSAEEKLAMLRERRNMYLTESDWIVTMHKELGTNIPAAWKKYRQELRDITDSATSLEDVTWPTKPS
tara:strand:- start:159 stop:512 length:354 start_codon:yes stop_codon:yes gene_type:complete